MKLIFHALILCLAVIHPALAATGEDGPGSRRTWIADNGNGTFTNPIFYDEFSDPDLIRVGDDYYLTGTTMHAMPGLPVLHSRDLVNWEFLNYAENRLDFGPECRLEDGKDIYGQGIWAPSFRYHDGKFYIFSNVNRRKTQLYSSSNPAGPWSHGEMKVSLHDLSVLFDDDGKVYVVWGYDEIHLAELTDDLTDLKPGTERVIIPKGSGAGEGSHFYKIDGKYFITLTNWDPVCFQVCARSSSPSGLYEITLISARESMGISTGWRLPYSVEKGAFQLVPPPANYVGCTTLHQGGIVQTQGGEWWGFTMMDHNSVGRLLCLSPVTWENGWPYLGLPGNLTRTPLTWVKPSTGVVAKPKAPYERSDDFSGPTLKPIWQWNHAPVDENWSLAKRLGYLCLRSLPAGDFWHARNSLTQRAIGPSSSATTELEVGGLGEGDIAGLALLNYPYSWIGIVKDGAGLQIQQFDQCTHRSRSARMDAPRVWLKVDCDFNTEFAQFSYSADGKEYRPLGERVIMAYQLKTFQGVRFALFNFNVRGKEGGVAAFNRFGVDESQPNGMTTSIPSGETVTLMNLADSTVLVNWKSSLRPASVNSQFAEGGTTHFRIIDKGHGRVALQSVNDGSYVTVQGRGGMSEVRLEEQDYGDASTFQWEDMRHGAVLLMSLKTHRYLCVDPHAGSLCSADSPGPGPDKKDGTCFLWNRVDKQSP
jgi:xylan 1,4-beta-xylosidase